jgi:hypothetical protein
LASKATRVLSLLLASAATAQAQVEDTSPPPDGEPPPTETTPPEPSSAGEQALSEALSEDAERLTETPSPAPTEVSAAERASDDEDEALAGLLLGISLGFAGSTGDSSDVYRTGRGPGLDVGYAWSTISIEARFGIYASVPRFDALSGSGTSNSYGTGSLIVRRKVLVRRKLALSVLAGVGLASAPVITVGINDFVDTGKVFGYGAVLGLAGHVRVRSYFEIVFEATGGLMSWGHTFDPRIIPTTTDTSADMVDYTTINTDLTGIPWTMTVGGRVVL